MTGVAKTIKRPFGLSTLYLDVIPRHLIESRNNYRIPPLITTCRYKRGVVISEGVVICEIDILYVIGTYAGFGLSVFLTLYDTYITTNFIVRNSI